MNINCNNDIQKAAEDHDSRSRFVFSLLALTSNNQGSSKIEINGTQIPKTIIQFWNDRLNIPNDVRECLNSWNILKRFGFQVLFFDEVEARAFISEHFLSMHVIAFDNCYHPGAITKKCGLN